MLSVELPERTRTHLERVGRGMARTPYAGSKAIARFLAHNFVYGCE